MTTIFGTPVPEEQVPDTDVTELIEEGQALLRSFTGQLEAHMPKVEEVLDAIRGTLVIAQLMNQHLGKSEATTKLGVIKQAILMTYALTLRELEEQDDLPNEGNTIPA